MDRAKEVGGARQVFQCKLEEERLAGLSSRGLLMDGGVVVSAVLDRLVEDRRVGGQPGDRELVDVALKTAAGGQRAGNVVEPDALACVVKLLRGFHRVSFGRAASSSVGKL